MKLSQRITSSPKVLLLITALLSHWLPMWFLDLFPQYSIILASNESDYVASWGRKVRNTIQEHSEELRVEISGDSSAANRWDTTEGGGSRGGRSPVLAIKSIRPMIREPRSSLL